MNTIDGNKLERRGPNGLRGFLRRNVLVFAAFFLPVILLLLAFAVEGIYPFGGNQIPVIDMYHQYIPFLSELQSKLQDGGSLFYTWNGAGGSNFWTLLAYYGASPLNLLLILFPQSHIVEGVSVILLIKIGLAGSFMAIYLRAVNPRNNISLIGFSTLYALCSYVMAYYWCIMWMDAVALLPLCILGLRRLMDGGRPVMYVVCLALTVFINYYMAIMVCIFIMFYYPVLYFAGRRGGGGKRFFAVTGRAVGYSLLGIAMSAVMLLPTWFGMQETYYISAEMPDNWVFYEDAIDVLNQLLPGSELTYRDGLPNLYCGLIVVILQVFYFISRTIPLREKLWHTGFLVFLFLSLNINKLDFIWHGFHFPNQLPYRYSFVICFLLIGIAYRVFLRADEFRVRDIWSVLAAGVGYYLLAQKLMVENIDDMDLFFYGGIAWLVLYCAVLLLYKKGKFDRTMLPTLILLLIVCEMATSTCTSLDTVGTTVRSSYFENREDIERVLEEEDDGFARTEIDEANILNAPAFYHYRGVSQFSSSLNANATTLMERIGLEGEPGKNRYNYNPTNPVTNAMLNIKYLIAKNTALEDDDFTEVARSGSTRLYESRYPLSIGYMTSSFIRTWSYDLENPFAVLDDYVRAVTENQYDGVFDEIAAANVSGSNVSLSQSGAGKWNCELGSGDDNGSVVLRYRADQTQEYYIFIEVDNAESIVVQEDGSDDTVDIRNDCGSIVNLGEIAAGTEFTVRVEYETGESGNITSHVCSMDEAVWQQTYEILSRDMLEVTDYTDTSLVGRIVADEDGIFVTSIPYENGWTLKVDGAEREIDELVGDCFISTSLSAGEHEIELVFRPPGLTCGALITLGAICVCVLLELLHRRRARREEELLFKAVFATSEQAAPPSEEYRAAGSDCNTER